MNKLIIYLQFEDLSLKYLNANHTLQDHMVSRTWLPIQHSVFSFCATQRIAPHRAPPLKSTALNSLKSRRPFFVCC